jgi:thiol-disulfide isomerase/thioredoxin
MRLVTALASSALVLACQRVQDSSQVERSDTKAPLTAAAAEPKVSPVDHHGIAWFENASAAAQAEAVRTQKPLLVDLWAPWCHTCLSMKSFVLTREKLGEPSADFVYLSLDTERAENAAVLEKLPIEAWPTFYVVEPRDLSIRGRWVGAAAPAEFADFMRDGKRAFELARAGTARGDDAFSFLLRGDELARERKYAEAAQAYGEAVLRGGASFKRRPDALVSQITSLYKAHDYSACADLASARMNDTGTSVSAADFAAYALSCAGELTVNDARQLGVQKLVAARLTPACESSAFTLTADDRSDACAMLRDAREAVGDEQGARRAAEARLTMLEQASKGMPDDVALTYDWARAETLIGLDRGAEALPFLEAREQALPKNYNPPHYLARVYKALEKPAQGLAALERAQALAYGPRKISMLGLKADLLELQGKRDQARAALTEQLAAYRALPAGQRRESSELMTEKRLAALSNSAQN